MNIHTNKNGTIDMGGTITTTVGEDDESPVSHFYNSYAYLSSLQRDWPQEQTRNNTIPALVNTPLTSRPLFATIRRKNILHLQQESEECLQKSSNSSCDCTCPCCHVHAKNGSEVLRLRAELARVCCERDSLAIQVEQLRMEIFAGELGRLDTKMGQSQSQGLVTAKLRGVGGLCTDGMNGRGRSNSGNEEQEEVDLVQLQEKCSTDNDLEITDNNGDSNSGSPQALPNDLNGAVGDHELKNVDTQMLLQLTSEIDEMVADKEKKEGSRSDDDQEDEDLEDEVEMISAHLIPQKVDDNVQMALTSYTSSEMTRLSSSSSSSSASSSPVLFTQQSTQAVSQPNFHDSTEDPGESAFAERRYGGVPARNAALVIQRAYRRYSMVKEFQRIKTERRLSRRINNNVVGSSSSPPVNSCDICIEVHPEGQVPHHHHHPHDLNLDGLEEGLDHELPQISEVEVQMQLVNNHHAHNLPPQYHYLHQHNSGFRQVSSGSRLPPQYNHPPTAYNNLQQLQQNNRQFQSQHHHHHAHHLPHQHSESSLLSTSSRLVRQPHLIPQSHSGSQLLPHQHSLPTSAPGLLMVKTNSHSSGNVNGATSSSSESATTTPLTNVSPNLSTGSSTGKAALSTEESEILRKRLYRVGLNLFNKKPEVGVTYLVKKKFLEGSPPSVARFLVSRKGLSKQMIGEYLTNLQSPFSMSCLEHFVNEIDLSSLPVDLALRKFQSYYRMPGEAQKIERLMESFSRRYAVCNPHVVSQFRNCADTVFVLAFAIIMLNTDLHTPHLKADRRMKLDDFIKNLRSVDDGGDIDREILVGIYDRIKSTEFKTGSDHVTQVMKVQQTIVGKKPNLAVPHRRLVCYCRLYEVPDTNKKEKAGTHQREVFLFNDNLVLTKIFHKKRNSVTYSFRQTYPLQGLTLSLFSTQYFEYGLALKRGEQTLLNLNARNDHDRAKFTEDLREAIAESDEMARIEAISKENRDRDSGVDVGKIKRFSNSLLDINDQCKPVRRGSCGSLDSGMSVSFQSDENHHPHALQASQPPILQQGSNSTVSSASSASSQHCQQPIKQQ